MKNSIKNFGKIIFWITYILLICKVLLFPLINEFPPLGPIYKDVAKRISSPDYTKMALLIRYEGLDLIYIVKIKEGIVTKTLHSMEDYHPDNRVNWKEELKWSYDSSFLIMIVDNPHDNNEQYMWAYDFKDNKEYTDATLIRSSLP